MSQINNLKVGRLFLLELIEMVINFWEQFIHFKT